MKKRNKVILPLILAIGGILAVFSFLIFLFRQQTTSTAICLLLKQPEAPF